MFWDVKPVLGCYRGKWRCVNWDPADSEISSRMRAFSKKTQLASVENCRVSTRVLWRSSTYPRPPKVPHPPTKAGPLITAYKNHWLPLIRPFIIISPLFLRGVRKGGVYWPAITHELSPTMPQNPVNAFWNNGPQRKGRQWKISDPFGELLRFLRRNLIQRKCLFKENKKNPWEKTPAHLPKALQKEKNGCFQK